MTNDSSTYLLLLSVSKFAYYPIKALKVTLYSQTLPPFVVDISVTIMFLTNVL